VAVQWLESFVLAEAAGAFVLASLNCRRLLGYARAARSAARRAGAGALCLMSAALGLEALAFAASPGLEADARAREIAVLVVRSALLAASALLTALLLRAGRSRA
jgi:hypothetical protein